MFDKNWPPFWNWLQSTNLLKCKSGEGRRIWTSYLVWGGAPQWSKQFSRIKRGVVYCFEKESRPLKNHDFYAHWCEGTIFSYLILRFILDVIYILYTCSNCTGAKHKAMLFISASKFSVYKILLALLSVDVKQFPTSQNLSNQENHLIASFTKLS